MRKVTQLLLFITILTLTSGCFLLPVAETFPSPPVVTMPRERFFIFEQVMRGDVISEEILIAEHIPAARMSHFFTEDNVKVLEVFVSFGDEVAEGDLLAMLDIGDLERELDELRRMRRLSELELRQISERQAFLLRQIPDMAMDSASYRWARDSLRLTMEHHDRLIEHVEQQIESRHLYAGMDGVITTLVYFFEGVYSNTRVNIATVSDISVTAFVVQGDLAEAMRPGDRFKMALDGETHNMIVIDPIEHGLDVQPREKTAYLTFVDEPPDIGFSTRGELQVVLGEASDVLYIHISLLHRVEDRAFVYVTDENGMRIIRNVVPGIEGKDIVEIISGLEEGELIIR
jgi:multidrug efflux pump subunit AcrA (membrane-fusion protein)